MADKKIHEKRHPLYENNVRNWQFYMESFKGGEEYTQKYLSTHRLENPTDYARRKNRAYYLNYCAPISTIPADYIFKKEATRPSDTNLTEFRKNIDRRGTNIHEFMKRVCTLSAIYGHVHIIIDKPKPSNEFQEKIEEGKITKLDSMVLRPYASIVHPQNLLDWSINPDTQELNWVLIYEEIFDDMEFMKDREISGQYKIWTTNEWIIFDDDNNEIDHGKHNLGLVPLITCYHKDIDLDMVGESMLKDVADTNKAIFNWCSNIDEMVSRQTFSQLIVPDDGSMDADEIDDQGKPKALQAIGTASLFTYPSESRHPPEFISPDAGQINIIWRMIENHIGEMFRMAGLLSTKATVAKMNQRTGRAQEMEFLDMAVFFANKAKKLEETENKLNTFYYAWMGEDNKPECVHYPEKFDITTPAEIVELFVKVAVNSISGRLNKEMAKRLVLQVLPHAEDKIVKEIYKEIEENPRMENNLYDEENKTDIEKTPGTEDDSGDSVKKEKEEIKNTKEKPVKEPVPNANRPGRRAKFRAQKSKKT